MDWCDVCKFNPPDYTSHEPDKPCGDCWVFGEGNEPTKFVETDNRPTNYDRLISKTPEEMAIWISAITWCEYCPTREHCDEVIQTRFCKEILLEWLKEEVKE